MYTAHVQMMHPSIPTHQLTTATVRVWLLDATQPTAVAVVAQATAVVPGAAAGVVAAAVAGMVVVVAEVAGAAMASGPVQGLAAAVAAARAAPQLVAQVRGPASKHHAQEQQGQLGLRLGWVQTSPCQMHPSWLVVLRYCLHWQHLPWRPQHQQLAGALVLLQ
jgi:hypothetical protein